jgi:hypothetical protein
METEANLQRVRGMHTSGLLSWPALFSPADTDGSRPQPSAARLGAARRGEFPKSRLQCLRGGAGTAVADRRTVERDHGHYLAHGR